MENVHDTYKYFETIQARWKNYLLHKTKTWDSPLYIWGCQFIIFKNYSILLSPLCGISSGSTLFVKTLFQGLPVYKGLR